MEGMFFFAMVCGLLGAILFLVTKSQNTKELIARIHSLEGFQSTQQFVSANSGIAIDDDHRTICLISRSPSITTRIVPYADILSSEIVEDGVSVTRSSRTSQAAGAILGGVLGGGIGAVVGSLTGTRVTRAKVYRIDLRIIVNDLQNPTHEVNFLDTPAKQGSMVYKPSRKAAEQWHALFDVIIRRADDEVVKTIASPPPGLRRWQMSYLN